MGEYLPLVTDWIEANAWWIVLSSVGYFFISIFFIRFFIIRIPPDFFLDKRSVDASGDRSFKRLILIFGKNVLGVILILVGLIMSIPGVAGQGFLTILLGLTLTDFPGKRRLEVKIIKQPLIRRAIYSLRQKAGKIPLILPPDTNPDES
jgi:hypothetical protein